MASVYKSGSVETYDDKAGYGYIIPDAPEESAPRLLIHRRSLRSPTLLLVPGERVLFQTAVIPRGLLASDVHLETPDDSSEIADGPSTAYGTITAVWPDRHFGFIKDDNGNKRFFHYSQITRLSGVPIEGVRVSFRPVSTDRGLQARDVQGASGPQDNTPATGAPNDSEPATAAGPRKQDNFLALAILARDSKKLDEAARLYERGMRESPSVQLITSYAAMEKNRNRRADALTIYERGLRIYPTNLKLIEDAGTVAASMGGGLSR
jgi:cold shock CspA family protein